VADKVAVTFESGALKGISQTVPDNVLAGGLKRASGDVTIDAGGANTVILRTNGVTSVTVTSDGKLTTSSTTTTPGLLIGSFTADPSVLANGDIWYNSTTGKFRAREAGASTDMIGGGGGASGWTDAGSEVHLTTSTDEVTVGASGGTGGKFTVVGDTIGQITTVIRMVASQTADALLIENSAGADQIRITASNEFVPATTNTGSVGTSGLKWANVFATTVTSGDLELESEMAKWTVREAKVDGEDIETLYAINRKTGKKYRLLMEELPE
jgi:hypothetical protein